MRAISIWSPILLAGLLCAALFPAGPTAAGSAAVAAYVFHRSWSAAGDQLRFPRGLAVAPDGDLYIANGDLHRIVYVRRGDRTFSVLASFGREPGEFDSPGDIALDTAGNLYITDTGNHRVQVLSAAGQFIRQWGGLTNTGEAGKFKYPQGIVVDPAGFVYVVDTYNHRIQKFTLDGQYRSQWGSQGSGAGQFSYPEGLAR
ncbi:MAG: NHL repeat-containing protein, partial [Anaerolineales bacterium]|nr:NHL repeat-containing protein [Anaerolineales bacterium]